MKADVESSTEQYARRFAGPIGEWFLENQLSITESMLGPIDETILDVGGGHAQLANPLYEKGYDVTVVGSEEICKARLLNGVKFVTGDLYKLPFPDRSFDTVVCFRIISHCPEWERLISELCRVSRKRVIIDYPTWLSLNALTPLLFVLKKKLEGNTRTYRMFFRGELNIAFSRNGFLVNQSRGQYFLPMVLYKALKSKTFAQIAEKFFSLLKLQSFSSPVIASWVRSTS